MLALANVYVITDWLKLARWKGLGLNYHKKKFSSELAQLQ